LGVEGTADRLTAVLIPCGVFGPASRTDPVIHTILVDPANGDGSGDGDLRRGESQVSSFW
jgi:hypothetical protein